MIYWLSLSLVLGALILESYLLKRYRAQVPIRIHVHGTRGKSSLTRLLAKSLTEKGFKTLAKTTGDQPEYLYPNGRPTPLRRLGPPRIQEHFLALRLAAGLGAQALVVEGLALDRETVHQSENILRSTQVVITNSRPDHAESMGPGRSGVISTLSLLMPKNGQLYVSNEIGLAGFQTLAAFKSLPLTPVNCPNPLNQAPELARALTKNLTAPGAPKKNFPKNPPQANSPGPGGPKPTIPTIIHFHQNRLPIDFLDLFSANDRLSSALSWYSLPSRSRSLSLKVAILSTRSDRPLRTAQFMSWLTKDPHFDLLVPLGHHALRALYLAKRAGSKNPSPKLIFPWPWIGPADLLKSLSNLAQSRNKDRLLLVGLGNAHGFGEKFRRFLAQKPARQEGPQTLDQKPTDGI
ncbi:MAG: hypothetical protein LBE80_02395, partial [Deltaproteobacteria bacterium]|nr:hypothetical protein [Deltaproteobacteria bacterium]